MSPNQDYIPYPPLSNQRPVQLRADSHYADDDPIIWPQPYIPYFLHYGAIPRPYTLPLHKIILFTPTHDHFWHHVHLVAPIHGLGKLSDDKFTTLKISINSLLDHVKLYQGDNPSSKQPPILRLLVKMLEHGLVWLKSVYTMFQQMEFSVQDVQHMWLELTALLDYMQVYKPRMDGYAPSASGVANTVGVFTHNLRVIQDFVTAGLPCWLICPASDFTNQNILKIIKPQCVEGIVSLTRHQFLYPVLFTGLASSLERYHQIHQYARNFLCAPDPFNALIISQSVNTSSNPSQVSSPSTQACQMSAESTVASSSTQPLPATSGNLKTCQQNHGCQKNQHQTGKCLPVVIISSLTPF